MEQRRILPIGHSGNCLEIFDSLRTQHEVPAILDDAERWHGACFDGVPILPLARASEFPDAQFLMLIASERTFRARREIIAGAGLEDTRFATFFHPTAEVSRRAGIGPGVVAYNGALVTSNARIGAHVLLMPRAIIHHDVVIRDWSVIGANVVVAGGAKIGESCYIGSGSAIRNGVTVGDGTLVGMGSVVVKDVPAGSVVAGNPARPLAGRSG